MELDPDFAPALRSFDLEALDRDRATIYAVADDMRLVFLNDTWRRFAAENGAKWGEGEWGLGASLSDAIPAPLRPFYDSLFAKVRRDDTPQVHAYECSSPEVERHFAMRVYPLAGQGFLLVHSLQVSEPHPKRASPPSERYVTSTGTVVMCAHCRRTRRVAGEQWDWVPAYVESVPHSTSHGLCPVCLDYHYPAA